MLRKLFGKKYRHLNKIYVSRSALEHNHFTLQDLQPGSKIAPVLKSNAYGHGLKTVASVFDNLHPEFLVVDSLYEAYELQKLKVNSKILILGYTHPENYAVKQLPFHIAVFDLETAQSLNNYQKNCKIHLFVDTGMNREGIAVSDLPEFIKQISQMKNLEVVGLTSHFADADNSHDQTYTQMQLLKFLEALEILREFNMYPQYRHISASGGALKITHKEINMIRAGLASYGYNPLEKSDPEHTKIDLQPALQLSSTLAHIKEIKEGSKVGYNCTYTAKKDMKIGLLPLGYYEGVDRRLSNKGFVLINGISCPIIGRVSMNMTTVDLSQAGEVQVGDEVVVYSNDVAEKNCLTEAARISEAIPYELLVHLAESIRREIVD